MNINSLRRPLGCLKQSMRYARQQRIQQRAVATQITHMDRRGEPAPVPAESKYSR